MDKSMFAAALTIAALSAPLCAAPAPRRAAPLQPAYQVGESLQLYFWEHRVTGRDPGEGASLVCTYSTRPVVMVYTRQINEPVARLIKKLDRATAGHQQQRLGSYVVLLCESVDRQKELKALAEKEKIQHTLLALVVAPKWQRFQARCGPEAETTVVLATAKREVRASYAYRKGELTDREVQRVLGDLPKVLPKKN
jgi:hypothetical protein